MKIIPSLIACGLMAAPLYAQNAPAPVLAATQTAQAQTALELLHPELALIPQAGVDALFCINRMNDWDELIQLELGKITQEEIDKNRSERQEYYMNEPRSMSFAGNSTVLEKLEPLSVFINLAMAAELNLFSSNKNIGSPEVLLPIFEQLLSKYPQPFGEGKIAPFYISVNVANAAEVVNELSSIADNKGVIEHLGFKGVRLDSISYLNNIDREFEDGSAPKTQAFAKDFLRRNPAMLAKAVGDNVIFVIVEDLADIAPTPENVSDSVLGSPLTEPLQAAAKEKGFIAAANMPMSLLRKMPAVSLGFPSGAAEMLEYLPSLFDGLSEGQSRGFEKLRAMLQSLAADAEQGNAFFLTRIGSGALFDMQLDLPCKETPFISGPKAASAPPAQGELLRMSMSPRRALADSQAALSITDAPAMLALSQLMFPKQAMPSMDKVLATASMQGLAALSHSLRINFSLSYMGDVLPLNPSFGEETWQGMELELFTASLPQLGELEWQAVSSSATLAAKKQWNRQQEHRSEDARLIEISEEEEPKAPAPKPAPVASDDPDEGEDYEEEESYNSVPWEELSPLYSAYNNLSTYKDMAEDISSIRFTVQPQDGKHKLRLQFIKK